MIGDRMTDERDRTGPQPPLAPTGLTRRGAIAGLCGVCVAAALAACSNGDEGAQGAPRAAATPDTPTPTRAAAPSGKPTKTPKATIPNPNLLAKPSDIPVGGGVVFPDKNVVVTQPQEGTFKGFSATCTHQGATLNAVSGGAIHCPRHGSAFSIQDGSVVNGPATMPLPKREIDVARNTISLP
jgi:Rieske Fe-S protein